jgi:hypothetical protein
MWQAIFCSEKWHAKLKGEKRVFGGLRAAAFDSCAALPALPISLVSRPWPLKIWGGMGGWSARGGGETDYGFRVSNCKGIDYSIKWLKWLEFHHSPLSFCVSKIRNPGLSC